MRKVVLLAAAATIAAATFAANAPSQAHGPGMTGGYGYGPGMMGPNMMGGPGYGSGTPGGYGYGPGWMMGPGMMGGYGPGYGMQGGYGPGWMMRGYGGGYGPGMMGGYGPGYYGNRGNLNLSTDDVKSYLERVIAAQGNPRLKVGNVKEKDADTIVADVVTKDNSLVQRFVFNRHTGYYQPEQSQ